MSQRDSLLVLRGPDVRNLLDGRRKEIIAAVSNAYCEHGAGHSFLPRSVFVRFPDREKERIIALPGYLGGDREIAGIKWIASFPKNLDAGMSRASAVMVLNSTQTGRPYALLEASGISAMRTAASAALAADLLHHPGDIDVLGLIGCGLINREIVRFIMSLQRKVSSIIVYDVDAERAKNYRESLAPSIGDIPFRVCVSAKEVLESSAVISFATTAVQPTVSDLAMARSTATILHVSLRDLMPDAILSADNVVDDIDHVLRAQTSVDLAKQKVGHADFIRCTLADIITCRQPPRRDGGGVVVFSPFGLGVLDLAVARLAIEYAKEDACGVQIDDFFAGT